MTTGATGRERAKADRHASLLREAARLFADRGYSGVSLEDIGAAVGVSGPAVYRHFANKQALLGTILTTVSEQLLAGADAVLDAEESASRRLGGLVAFHVDFALDGADVIRVHDRDLGNLGDDARRTVRRLQRAYVERWVGVLAARHPGRDEADLRVRAHACFGLINSTSHSIRGLEGSSADVHGILQSMALAALDA